MAHNRARQSARDIKKRKAKARAKQAAEYRSWIDRPKIRARSTPNPFADASASISMGEMLVRNPELMDRLFGDTK